MDSDARPRSPVFRLGGSMTSATAMAERALRRVRLLRATVAVAATLAVGTWGYWYLSDGQQLRYTPDRAELERFERLLIAIWRAIREAVATGDFRPRRSWMCRNCDHQQRCPEFGGTIPEYPGPPPGF